MFFTTGLLTKIMRFKKIVKHKLYVHDLKFKLVEI